MNYQNKYLKYKNKYKLVKTQKGGGYTEIAKDIESLKQDINSAEGNAFKDLKTILSEENRWQSIVNQSINEMYGLDSDENQNYRLHILCKNLFAFCRDGNITTENTHDKVKKLFIDINRDLDKELNTDFSYCKGYHFVIGTSQMTRSDDPPISVGDAVAYFLAGANSFGINNSKGVITFGTKESTITDKESPITDKESLKNIKLGHIKWDLLNINDNSTGLDKDSAGLEWDLDKIINILSKDILDKEGLTIYFTYGSHEFANNIISTTNFEKAFKKSKKIQELLLNGKLRLIFTGTDGFHPSTWKTFYKVGLGTIKYSNSKMYQLVRCAQLMQYSTIREDLLKQLIPSTSWNTYTPEENCQTVIAVYDKTATAILASLNTIPNFNWAQNLSVMLTNMHVKRLSNYENSKYRQEIEKGMLEIDVIKNCVTDNILFRGKNMITVKQAALEHIFAFHRIKKFNLCV